MYMPKLEVVLYALEMPEGMRRVLLCMLEAAEGELCLLEVPELMRCVLLYILELVEGRLSLLLVSEALEVLPVPDVMRCVQILCRYALRVGSDAVFRKGGFCFAGVGGVGVVGGDAPCATLYTGGRGG